MDWTGYPVAMLPEDMVPDLPALAAFLASAPGNDFTEAVLALCADWQAEAGALDQLSLAFPREVLAWRTWVNYPPPMTAAALLDALAVIPDAPVDSPDVLLPVQLDKLSVYGLPSGQASVTMKHRLDTGQPWRTQQFVMPVPTVEIDPRLLNSPAGATLLVRLTVAEQ